LSFYFYFICLFAFILQISKLEIEKVLEKDHSGIYNPEKSDNLFRKTNSGPGVKMKKNRAREESHMVEKVIVIFIYKYEKYKFSQRSMFV